MDTTEFTPSQARDLLMTLVGATADDTVKDVFRAAILAKAATDSLKAPDLTPEEVVRDLFINKELHKVPPAFEIKMGPALGSSGAGADAAVRHYSNFAPQPQALTAEYSRFSEEMGSLRAYLKALTEQMNSVGKALATLVAVKAEDEEDEEEEEMEEKSRKSLLKQAKALLRKAEDMDDEDGEKDEKKEKARKALLKKATRLLKKSDDEEEEDDEEEDEEEAAVVNINQGEEDEEEDDEEEEKAFSRSLKSIRDDIKADLLVKAEEDEEEEDEKEEDGEEEDEEEKAAKGLSAKSKANLAKATFSAVKLLSKEKIAKSARAGLRKQTEKALRKAHKLAKAAAEEDKDHDTKEDKDAHKDARKSLTSIEEYMFVRDIPLVKKAVKKDRKVDNVPDEENQTVWPNKDSMKSFEDMVANMEKMQTDVRGFMDRISTISKNKQAASEVVEPLAKAIEGPNFFAEKARFIDDENKARRIDDSTYAYAMEVLSAMKSAKDGHISKEIPSGLLRNASEKVKTLFDTTKGSTV